MNIREYQGGDEAAVVQLWKDCDLVRPWNDPHKDIRRKLTVQPELFLVGLTEGRVMASVMAGFDGHRVWVNYLAVAEQYRRQGAGRALMDRVEALLKDIGCPKLNLQIRSTNAAVLAFYERLGCTQDQTVSLGKRLIPDG